MTNLMRVEERMVENVSNTCFRHKDLALINTKEKGRGVIATAFISAGTVIERSPVVPVDSLSLVGTRINDHAFAWDGSEAIVFGLTSFVNHSNEPNCVLSYDYENLFIELVSKTGINASEELTYDYVCDLWFEVKE